MSALSQRIVDEFWELCNVAHECWLARRGLFEDNPDRDYLFNTFCGPFLLHLSNMTQQHVLHQIAKLHDPAVQSGNINTITLRIFLVSSPCESAR